MAEFDLVVAKPDFKFHASHFIAHNGYRERLHGHTYKAQVTITAQNENLCDGYIIDFSEIKKVMRSLCDDLNESFLVPVKSPVLQISERGAQVLLECQDRSVFSIPKDDCKFLPVAHTSVEEMSRYLWCRFVRDFGLERLHYIGVTKIALSLTETEGQTATFRSALPELVPQLEATAGNPVGASKAVLQGVPSYSDLLEEARLEITNGDDDLAYMPEAPDVVIST